IIDQGSGDLAAKGATVEIEYTGTLYAGTVFDSSEERGKNFSFVLGAAKVIKAMDLLVSTMKVGERAQLICRSDYGYGSEGLRSSKGDVMVPPFATLCFDIKLVSAD
ncbi:hypothetical protein THAPSDRAFT_35200, partial [Thalassiosira pseudonana CCMP1335]